jgi:hypothetical protein
VQLCPRAKEPIAPRLTVEIAYPAEPNGYYGLTDGTGLQAFVVVASRRQLPAFATWPARAALPWKAISANGLYRFDGRTLTTLADPDRGTERRLSGTVPVALNDVCNYLIQQPDVDAVQAWAFPVVAR